MPGKSFATIKAREYDVAVVGAGTTGLTLAQLLVEKGIRVAVVDPNRLVCQHPRASHVDDECMRVLASVGYADEDKDFLRQTGFDIYDPDGELLMAWQIEPGETDQGWKSDYMFHQPDFEATLRGRLVVAGLSDLWLGWEVVGAGQDESAAHLDIRHRKSGATERLRASYVVGCDGARSFLRELVMTGLTDFEGTKRSLIVDVHQFQPAEGLSPSGGFILCGGETPITYVPIVAPIARFQFMLVDHDDLERYEDPLTIYSLLSRWLEPDTYRILRSDVYEWNAHLVRGWRSGRFLIAGDAAHLMPPMIGQGMCSGFRDSMNLGWKLAAVLSGTSDESLLDTYETERSPHVGALIAESTRQANVIAALGRSEQPAPHPRGQVVNREHQPIGPGFADDRFTLAGALAPQPKNEAGELLDAEIGYNFAIVGAPRVLDGVDGETRAVWRSLNAVVIPRGGPVFTAWLVKAQADVAIVRPDRYVFAATSGVRQLAEATVALRDRLVPATVDA